MRPLAAGCSCRQTGENEKWCQNCKTKYYFCAYLVSTENLWCVLNIENNYPNAKIYIQKTACGEFYNYRNQEEKYIGMDKRISELKQVAFLEGDFKIDEELSIFTGVTGRKLWPKGNEILKFDTRHVISIIKVNEDKPEVDEFIEYLLNDGQELIEKQGFTLIQNYFSDNH